MKIKNGKEDMSSTSLQQGSEYQDEQKIIEETLSRIKHKVIILSGKGGVGKSTVAVNMAAIFAGMGHKVGLLDIDIHGPSVPKLLGLEGETLASRNNKLIPVDYSGSLKVISIGFLIQDHKEPVIWRGPLKYGVIKQFIKDVAWGDLDFLFIDSPPGTGDEPLSVCQLIGDADGAVVVTTPQEVALMDVRKSITFCQKLNMPVLGVVENMSGFTCPHCGEKVDIFKRGGGKRMAEEMGVPFLGYIPLNAEIVLSGDSGNPAAGGKNVNDEITRSHLNEIADNLIDKISL